jgi:hypothetical protein
MSRFNFECEAVPGSAGLPGYSPGVRCRGHLTYCYKHWQVAAHPSFFRASEDIRRARNPTAKAVGHPILCSEIIFVPQNPAPGVRCRGHLTYC